jgi:hypothetical protein
MGEPSRVGGRVILRLHLDEKGAGQISVLSLAFLAAVDFFVKLFVN